MNKLTKDEITQLAVTTYPGFDPEMDIDYDLIDVLLKAQHAKSVEIVLERIAGEWRLTDNTWGFGIFISKEDLQSLKVEILKEVSNG